ncbi:MAG: ABC transporter substrate-binding protein [Proteobacteria bacterium]|nr:ABC transporter substrate-binding protein [Pseudomonadota bacterium]
MEGMVKTSKLMVGAAFLAATMAVPGFFPASDDGATFAGNVCEARSKTEPSGSATQIVKATIDKVLNILNDPQLKAPAQAQKRLQKLEETVTGMIDLDMISARVLGDYWNKLDAAQKDEFKTAFRRYVSDSYANRLNEFSGAEVKYLSERYEKARSMEYAEVRTAVSTSKLCVPMDYRLIKGSEGWRSYDVLIDQISLVSNFRGQFKKIIETEGFETLLRKLKEKAHVKQSADATATVNGILPSF